jgi:hypothetical protein
MKCPTRYGIVNNIEFVTIPVFRYILNISHKTLQLS